MVEALIRKEEIVSESEARDHYDEKSDELPLAKPVNGVNKGLVENNDHKNGGGIITHSGEKENPQLDNDFLLKYFQEKDIKQIELTPEGNLLIEYNSGKSKIITNSQVRQQELQKVISFYQKSGQTSLTQQDLVNMNNSNSIPSKNTNNNNLLISLGLGGVLIIGLVIG
ncbi:14169_t:CDS:2, partial [Funneliformis geosporum]